MKKIELGQNSFFIGEELTIGSCFKIAPHTVIRATKCNIGDYVTIGGYNNFLVGEDLQIGNNATLGNRNEIVGRSVIFGDYLYFDSDIMIGHGGRYNYDSRIRIGDHCMICSHVKLNINYAIEIGEGVGLGENVDIWTHGSYPPVLEGFPFQFGPVTIGNKVWIPAKTTVLPNVTIGDNVVLGVHSVVNKDLPSGCLAGGIPAKIIRENAYPKYDIERNKSIIKEVLSEYRKLLAFKEQHAEISFDEELFAIKVNNTSFYLNSMQIEGAMEIIEEDFRDFLRRRGIKFFTGKPFKSILPPCYQKLLSYE